MTQEQIQKLIAFLDAADIANDAKYDAALYSIRICSLDKMTDGYQMQTESFMEAVMEMDGKISVTPFTSADYDHHLSSEFAGRPIFTICTADELATLQERHPHLFEEQA